MNNNFFVKNDEITELDIELTNYCNLKCPLCLSQNNNFKTIFKPHNIDLNIIYKRIEKFKNLDTVLLCGDASEPSLYPKLFELLTYLKSKSNIFVEFFTNGNTHNEIWWNNLNKFFNKNSFICFTIAGIYNYSNNIYRRGSNLYKILKNALAFNTNNPNNNLNMQYIRFEYNKNEKINDILNILKKFPKYNIINTDPIGERFLLSLDLILQGICCDKVFLYKYYLKIKELKNKRNKILLCHNFNKKLIKMDTYGNLYPCILWRLYSNTQKFEYDTYLDYNSIFNNLLKYCYECDKELILFLKDNNHDLIFMC